MKKKIIISLPSKGRLRKESLKIFKNIAYSIVKCQNNNKNNIWISLKDSTNIFNHKCHKFRIDKFQNGEDPNCGFEIHFDEILRKLHSTEDIIISFDKDGKNLLSGKRCANPCKTCNADGTLLGKNHAAKWKTIYNIN